MKRDVYKRQAYQLNGEIIHALPAVIQELDKVEPIYEEMPGWSEDITHVTSFEELPINCQNYLKRISELVHCPIAVSYTHLAVYKRQL